MVPHSFLPKILMQVLCVFGHMYRIDDMEASKFTNLASIRVSMGTSQSTSDGEDVRSKVKSLRCCICGLLMV